MGHKAKGQARSLFVIEADEYDTAFFDKRSKFVHYRPRTALLNNLEFDHADIFGSLADIERQFHHLLRTVPGEGAVIWNAQEPALQRVLAQGCWSEQHRFANANPSATAGPAEPAEWQVRGHHQQFEVLHRGEAVAQVAWDLTGAHNQLNALAALAAAHHVGVQPAVAAEALGQFRNVRRRLEVRGAAQGITVYDDFAHHPTAIQTTLEGLRQRVGSARVLAVFEPRSNTMKLGTMAALLPQSLEQADLAFCHTAGLGWDARTVLAPMGERARVADTIDDLVIQVTKAARAGDHILCMSNGSFGGIHERLLSALAQAKLTS
jgi:UDP-N-acetylmuramate: L-alanyl-gamma-D-glutamyl-meso-diaminopimelate ligase